MDCPLFIWWAACDGACVYPGGSNADPIVWLKLSPMVTSSVETTVQVLPYIFLCPISDSGYSQERVNIIHIRAIDYR